MINVVRQSISENRAKLIKAEKLIAKRPKNTV